MASQDAARSDPVVDRLAGLGASPGLVIGAGVLSIVIGVLVLVWPGYSVVVLAWLFAIQLIVTGVLQLIAAFAGAADTAGRVLFGVLGALTILVALLCLRAPLQTAVVLGLLIGATWLVGGVITIVHAIGAGPGSGRGWRIASGVVSVIGGAVVLVYPGASVVTLTWLLGIVLVITGVVVLVQGFMARRARRPARDPAVAPPSGAATASP